MCALKLDGTGAKVMNINTNDILVYLDRNPKTPRQRKTTASARLQGINTTMLCSPPSNDVSSPPYNCNMYRTTRAIRNMRNKTSKTNDKR